MSQFMFSTGIENSYPTIRLPDGTTKRIDEMEKCGHYKRWRDDFQLVNDMGIHHLSAMARRFTAPTSARTSTIGASATRRSTPLRQMRINPIVDLCHFGVPDWIGDFQNPDWPVLFAQYAKALSPNASPWVKYYTPVNEIFIAALFSSQYGWWNEKLASDRDFCRALKHLAMANILAMRAILEIRSDAIFIQSESSEYFHPEDPDCLYHRPRSERKRFLSLDLTYGYPLNVTMYEYLLDNGWTRDEYAWFGAHHVKASCVMGNDYYVTNEHLVHKDGTYDASGEIFGYYVITQPVFQPLSPARDAHRNQSRQLRNSLPTGCASSGPTCSGCVRTAFPSSGLPGTA